MLKKSLIGFIGMSLVLCFNGCDSSTTSNTNTNAEVTTLDISKMDNEFSFVTSGSNFSEYFHLEHQILNSSGTSIFKTGINSNGTINTRCEKVLYSGDYIEYECTTKKESSLNVTTKYTIKLRDGESYYLYRNEYKLSGESNKKKIGKIK